jgi:hypothetical protein
MATYLTTHFLCCSLMIEFILYIRIELQGQASNLLGACWQNEDNERSFSVEDNMSYYNVLPLHIPDTLDSLVNNYYKGVLVMDESAG